MTCTQHRIVEAFCQQLSQKCGKTRLALMDHVGGVPCLDACCQSCKIHPPKNAKNRRKRHTLLTLATTLFFSSFWS
jgi:hypothetical protein